MKRAALITMVSLVVAGSAWAQETQEYSVVSGDTCESVAMKFWGDAKRYDELHAMNPQLGPMPHKLKPGQVLQVTRPGPPAKVTFVRKNVQAATPTTHPAQLQEPLDRGHKVSTLSDSSAEVTFKDTTRLQLAEHTLVVILGGASTSSSVQATSSDTTLLTGSLRTHLGALAGKSKPIATPGAKVDVGPGEAKLEVDEKKTTSVAVYKGKSALSASGKKVEVPQGFGSKADLGKAPIAPKPLPPAPIWAKAPARTLLTFDVAAMAASYAGGTGAGSPAETWHVQLSRDIEFNDLVVDAKVSKTVTDLAAQNLTAGVYHARVSAIDADRFEGPYSALASVQVVKVTPVAASAGARARVDVGTGVFCALDGAPLAAVQAPLELSPAKPHVLECAPTATGEGSAKLALDAKLAGPAVTKVTVTQQGRDRLVTVRVTDTDGAPVAGATIVMTALPGVQLAAFRETEPGTYTALASGGGAGELGIAVNGVPSGTSVLPDVPSEGPRAPADERRLSRFEVGVSAGGQSARLRLGLGLGLGLEIAVQGKVGPGVASVGLRPTYERYGVTSCEGCPSGHLGDAYGASLPLSYRFTGLGRFMPFAMVAPMLVHDRIRANVEVAVQDVNAERFPARTSVALLLGGGLRIGLGDRSALLVEGGYRFASVHEIGNGDVSLAGPWALLGFRYGL